MASMLAVWLFLALVNPSSAILLDCGQCVASRQFKTVYCMGGHFDTIPELCTGAYEKSEALFLQNNVFEVLYARELANFSNLIFISVEDQLGIDCVTVEESIAITVLGRCPDDNHLSTRVETEISETDTTEAESPKTDTDTTETDTTEAGTTETEADTSVTDTTEAGTTTSDTDTSKAVTTTMKMDTSESFNTSSKLPPLVNKTGKGDNRFANPILPKTPIAENYVENTLDEVLVPLSSSSLIIFCAVYIYYFWRKLKQGLPSQNENIEMDGLNRLADLVDGMGATNDAAIKTEEESDTSVESGGEEEDEEEVVFSRATLPRKAKGGVKYEV